jgi:NO-binding membrane sensor protein with MHYT domain
VVSVLAAIAHNAASSPPPCRLGDALYRVYAPALLAAGIATGAFTGVAAVYSRPRPEKDHENVMHTIVILYNTNGLPVSAFSPPAPCFLIPPSFDPLPLRCHKI